MAKGKLKLSMDDFSFDDNNIKEEPIKEEKAEPVKEEKKPETVKEEKQASVKPQEMINEPAPVIEPEQVKAEEPVKPKSTRGRKPKAKSSADGTVNNADFLQIDIRGMRDYLSTITSYEAMKTGDKVSFNTYIRNLIEKDMKKNAEVYRKFKEMLENF